MRRFLSTFLILVSMGMFFSCKPSIEDGEYNLELYAQNDIHGRFFDSLYVENAERLSVANISEYLNLRRQESGADKVIAIDNGDHLQGDIAAYYYNFVYDYSSGQDKRHLFSQICDYMNFDAVVVGNHDIEAGHSNYDRIKADLQGCGISYLAANAIDETTNESYFEPYTILDKGGVKVAVIGMTNPAIKKWLPEHLWKGIDFVEIKGVAEKLVAQITKEHNPQLIILAVHAGLGDGSAEDIENPARYLAANLKGVDIVLASHDHRVACEKVFNGVDSVLVMDGGSHANNLQSAKIKLVVKDNKVVEKKIEGEIISMKHVAKDEAYLEKFRGAYLNVKDYTNAKIGKLDKDLYTRDAFFGPSDYINLIHTVQLDKTGADVSFAAPNTYNSYLPAGDLLRSDLFLLYPFENTLFKISMTGKQIRDYLEFSYDNWICTVRKPGDHIFNMQYTERNGVGRYWFKNMAFNFDAAAGVNYIVDVTKEFGERVSISSLHSGEKFHLDSTYTVAVNSYRASGGGDLLKIGAGIDPHKDLQAITLGVYPEVRNLIDEYFKNNPQGAIKYYSNWKFGPDNLAVGAIKRDRKLLFQD